MLDIKLEDTLVPNLPRGPARELLPCLLAAWPDVASLLRALQQDVPRTAVGRGAIDPRWEKHWIDEDYGDIWQWRLIRMGEDAASGKFEIETSHISGSVCRMVADSIRTLRSRPSNAQCLLISELRSQRRRPSQGRLETGAQREHTPPMGLCTQ